MHLACTDESTAVAVELSPGQAGDAPRFGGLFDAARGRVPAFHIGGPGCLLSADRIRHKPVDRTGEEEAWGWLPEGPCTVGFTAGASTPNNKVGEAIERVFELKGVDLRSAIGARGDPAEALPSPR